MAGSASASYSMDDFADKVEVHSDEDSIGEDISEALSGEEDYSEEFAEATMEATMEEKKRDENSQSVSQSGDQCLEESRRSSIQEQSHSASDQLSAASPPPPKLVSPPSPPSRPLVGIASPPKPARRLAEAAGGFTATAAASRPAVNEESATIQSEMEESYSEDFAEATLGSSKGAKGAMHESLGGSHSYSDDFAEGSKTAGQSLSMSEAISSTSRSEGKLRRAMEEASRAQAETERKKDEEISARKEERRRQIAEMQQKTQVFEAPSWATTEASATLSSTSTPTISATAFTSTAASSALSASTMAAATAPSAAAPALAVTATDRDDTFDSLAEELNESIEEDSSCKLEDGSMKLDAEKVPSCSVAADKAEAVPVEAVLGKLSGTITATAPALSAATAPAMTATAADRDDASDSVAEECDESVEGKSEPKSPSERKASFTFGDNLMPRCLNMSHEDEEKEAVEAARLKAEEEQAQKQMAAQEAQEQAKREVQEKERKAQEEAKKDADENLKRVAEEKAKQDAEEKAKQEAEVKAKREAEETAEREAHAKAERKAQETAERVAQEKADRDAQETAERDAQETAEEEARETAEREAAEKEAKEKAEKASKEEASTPDGERNKKENQKEMHGAERAAELKAEQEASEAAEQEAQERAHAEKKRGDAAAASARSTGSSRQVEQYLHSAHEEVHKLEAEKTSRERDVEQLRSSQHKASGKAEDDHEEARNRETLDTQTRNSLSGGLEGSRGEDCAPEAREPQKRQTDEDEQERGNSTWGGNWAWSDSGGNNKWGSSQDRSWRSPHEGWRWSDTEVATSHRWRDDDLWYGQQARNSSYASAWQPEHRPAEGISENAHSDFTRLNKDSLPSVPPLPWQAWENDHVQTASASAADRIDPFRLPSNYQQSPSWLRSEGPRLSSHIPDDRTLSARDERWLQDLRLGTRSPCGEQNRPLEQENAMPNIQHNEGPSCLGKGKSANQLPPTPPLLGYAWQDVADWKGPGVAANEKPSALLRAAPALCSVCPEDFVGAVAIALGEVIDGLLELKYNIGLDIAAFAKHVEASCEGYASLSLERMLTHLNSKADLRCLDKRKEYELRLHLGFRRLEHFEELRRVVRLVPGTCSAAAVVTVGGVDPALDVVAAFRIAYSDASRVVGRSGKGGGQPLHNFSQEDFCGGVAIDPEIVSMWHVKASVFGPSGPLAAPPHAPEYAGLEPLLKYVHGDCRTPPGSIAPSVPPSLLAVLHTAAPTEETMKKVRDLLERPDVDPDGLVELFKKLAEWLKNEPHAALARHGLVATMAHKSLISTMCRHSTHRELAAWACRVIGWSSRQHVENAVLFNEARAIEEVCKLLEQHRIDKDLHRHGLYAIGCLAHYGGGTPQALNVGAVSITLRSLATHRDSPTVHVNGCEVLRCLADAADAPMEELAMAAQEAKRTFPRDRTVHRAADALLTLVVPRTVGAVGMLMDSKMGDPEVQNSAARTLGQLAGFGGIAWKGSASGAVSRIIRAMGNHRHNVALQAVCLWALGRLAERVEAPTAGMFDAADRAKKHHTDSALVCRHAGQLCSYLLRP